MRDVHVSGGVRRARPERVEIVALFKYKYECGYEYEYEDGARVHLDVVVDDDGIGSNGRGNINSRGKED